MLREEDVSTALKVPAEHATGTRPMKQVETKNNSRQRSDSISTANIAQLGYCESPPYGKIHAHRGGRVRGNSEVSHNGEEAFHYRQKATYTVIWDSCALRDFGCSD